MSYFGITSEEELLLAILASDEPAPTTDEMTVIREFFARDGVVDGYLTKTNQKQHYAWITIIQENLKFEIAFRCLNFFTSRKPVVLNMDHVFIKKVNTDYIVHDEPLRGAYRKLEIYALWEEVVSPSLVKSYMDEQIENITKSRYQLLQSR